MVEKKKKKRERKMVPLPRIAFGDDTDGETVKDWGRKLV